jgi:hypothetical protein
MENTNTMELTQEQIAQINKYIVEMSYFLPDEVRSSAKWQNESSEVLASLEIN